MADLNEIRKAAREGKLDAPPVKMAPLWRPGGFTPGTLAKSINPSATKKPKIVGEKFLPLEAN